MTTVRQAIDRATNDYLLTGQRPQRNVLLSGVTPTDTLITFHHELSGISGGSKLSIGLEDMHVVSVDATANTAVVIRGDYGTDAADHDGESIVWVNSKFSPAAVFRAINAELDSLSGEGLFQMKATELTYIASVRGYDLTGIDPDTVLGIYEVRASTSGPWENWPLVWSYELTRTMDPGEFSSGMALVLHDYVEVGQTVRIRYMAPFDNVTALTDELTAVSGLHPQAHDIVSIGAACRLVAGREIKRNFTEAQGDTRRAEEVPPGASLQSVRGLLALREERVDAERMRLTRLYPPRLIP